MKHRWRSRGKLLNISLDSNATKFTTLTWQSRIHKRGLLNDAYILEFIRNRGISRIAAFI